MLKTKKCKGSGKALGHGCGNSVPIELHGRSNRVYGLGKSCGCYQSWLLDTPNGQETLNKMLVRNKSNYEKKVRVERKKEKETLIEYDKKLQYKINEIVRLIDIGLPCLARGYHAKQIHAGHIFSRGSEKSMRYNAHNIHRQSAQSNHFQNEDGLLREGLVKEYGEDYFAFISELRQTPPLKYSNMEYRAFYKHACTLANELKKQGRMFPTINERISMRNEVNNLLGIYDEKFCTYKK